MSRFLDFARRSFSEGGSPFAKASADKEIITKQGL